MAVASAHDIIVGVHGNGLTNLLWLPAGSAVLEIFPDGFHQYDYQILAELAGITYFGVQGSRVHRDFGRDGPQRGGRPEGDVSITALSWQTIHLILAGLKGAVMR